jgi:hypothetical protein
LRKPLNEPRGKQPRAIKLLEQPQAESDVVTRLAKRPRSHECCNRFLGQLAKLVKAHYPDVAHAHVSSLSESRAIGHKHSNDFGILT